MHDIQYHFKYIDGIDIWSNKDRNISLSNAFKFFICGVNLQSSMKIYVLVNNHILHESTKIEAYYFDQYITMSIPKSTDDINTSSAYLYLFIFAGILRLYFTFLNMLKACLWMKVRRKEEEERTICQLFLWCIAHFHLR